MGNDLFGSLDVQDDIPEDPYFVGAGTYKAVIVDASDTQETRDGDPKATIEYEILDYIPEDDEPDYSGQSVTEWFDRFPDLTTEDLAAMDKKERKSVLQRLARLRNRIEHLGFDPTDSDFEFSQLKDVEVGLTIKVNEGKDGRRFSNVSYVKAQHLIDAEESLLED